MRYLVALFLMLAAPAWADGWLSIEPVSQTVQVGQTFDVQLWVSQAGSDFNAVETAIPFDSSLVDYVYVNQLFHEGPYLREAMRGRLCGNNQVGGFTWW